MQMRSYGAQCTARRRGTRARLGLLVGVSILCLVVGVGSASASQGDVAATRTYLEVNYGFVQLVASKIKPIEARLHEVQSQVARECPMAAIGSPEDAQSEQLSNEVIGTLVESAVPLLVHPAALRFLLVAGGLHWSDAGLTSAVHSYVAKLEKIAILGIPSLCTDVRAWAASGYRTLPASTLSFEPQFMSNWVSAGELPAGLTRYESASERPLLRRTHQLEDEIAELEAREAETWRMIMNDLVLLP